jgi:hypothetical protein
MMGYQANWYLARQFGGTGRLLQSNPRTYSARSLSCGIYAAVIGGNWEPYTTSVAVGQSADLGELFAEVGLTESGDNYGYCFGSYVGTSTSFYYYWETLSPSIASISGPNYESYVNAQGVSPGNATIFGAVWDQYGCGWDQYVGETVTADQTPVIYGISPGTWNAGATTPVTFTGQSFGTNAPTLTFSDPTISYTLVSYSDGQIVANITVAAGTQTENVSVWVTNNGYGVGNGFYGGSGSGAQSAQSAPATATVQTPIPSNLQLTSPEDEGGGFLTMKFTWGSTSGKLSDLGACQVRENVTYPTGGNSACPPNAGATACYWPPSPPWPPTTQPGTAYPNPTLVAGPASAGGVFDNNTITNQAFVKPYSQSSFPATQIFQYSCSGGPWTTFGGSYTITRQVTQQNSNWVFMISKTGISFSSVLVLP